MNKAMLTHGPKLLCRSFVIEGRWIGSIRYEGRTSGEAGGGILSVGTNGVSEGLSESFLCTL